jgi:hypothetical protein
VPWLAASGFLFVALLVLPGIGVGVVRWLRGLWRP